MTIKRYFYTTVATVLAFTATQSQTIRYQDTPRITQYADSMVFSKAGQWTGGTFLQIDSGAAPGTPSNGARLYVNGTGDKLYWKSSAGVAYDLSTTGTYPSFDSLNINGPGGGSALLLKNNGDPALVTNGDVEPSLTNTSTLGSSSKLWLNSYVKSGLFDTVRSVTATKPLMIRGGIGTRGAQENALEVRSSGGRFIWGVMADSNRWGSQIGDTTDVDPTVRIGDQFRTEMSAWVDEGLMLSRAGTRIVTTLTANAARGDKFLKVGSITGATLDHNVGIGSDDSVDVKEISRSSADTIYLRRPLQYPHLSGDTVYIDKWRGSIFPVSNNNLPSGTMYLGAEQTAAESTLAPQIVRVAPRVKFSASHFIGIGADSAIVRAAGRNYLAIRGSTDDGRMEFSTNAADATGNAVGYIQATDINSAAANKRIAAIQFTLTGGTSNNRGGQITFYTKSDNVSGTTEAVRIDTNQSTMFGIGNVIVNKANTARIEIDGTDGSETAGSNDIYESGGDMFHTSRGSNYLMIDNDNNSTSSVVGVRANGTASDVFAISEVGNLSNIHATTTEGWGVGAIVDTVEKSAQAASIAATNLNGTTSTGNYEISYYGACTTANGTSTVSITIDWDNGTKTSTSATFSNASVNNYVSGTLYVRNVPVSSSAIRYSTTVSGTIGSATYYVSVTAKRVY